MKIAFIAHAFPRLHNTFILNEIIELIKQGHHVKVISIQKTHEKVINKDVVDYKLLEKTTYFEDYPSEFNAELDLYRSCLKSGVDWIQSIAKQLKEEGFDIIHGIFGNRPATAAMLLSRASGIPFSFESHAYDLFVDFQFADEKIRDASIIFTESNYNLEHLVKKDSSAAGKTEIVHLAPNLEMLDELPVMDRVEGLIVSACRLHPIKGLEFGLQAIKLLVEKFPKVRYLVLGDGILGQELVSFSVAQGLQEVVGFYGDTTNEQVAEIVRQASVFLLPCVIAEDGDRDGTPTAITEAMYLETPVVSTNISGIPELVDHDVNGYLVEPKSPKALAEALEKLLLDAELRASFGKAGKEKVKREFNIHKSCQRMIELWENALK